MKLLDVIQHHGIKGQKWGVRNGPPYPLKASDRSSSERRAGQQKTVNKSYNSVDDFIDGMKNKVISEFETNPNNISPDIGKFVETMSVLEQYNQDKKIKNINEAPRLKNKMSTIKNMELTNPGYPQDGTTMNCTLCTTAMALREKGYDVTARKFSNNGHGLFSEPLFKVEFMADTVEMKNVKSGKDVLKELSSQGDGAYGNLDFGWTDGGGHSVFWKNENGKTRIYDGQCARELAQSERQFESLASHINLNDICYTRLDNCEPTEYAFAVVEPYEKKRVTLYDVLNVWATMPVYY